MAEQQPTPHPSIQAGNVVRFTIPSPVVGGPDDTYEGEVVRVARDGSWADIHYHFRTMIRERTRRIPMERITFVRASFEEGES